MTKIILAYELLAQGMSQTSVAKRLGRTRYSSGTTPTNYTYTGQL